MPDYEDEVARQPDHEFVARERQELRYGQELARARRRFFETVRRWIGWVIGVGIAGAVGLTQLWDKWRG